MMETCVTIEVVLNSMGYLPLILVTLWPDGVVTTCLACVLCRMPNGAFNTCSRLYEFSPNSAEGNSYKKRWRHNHDSFYQVNTDEFPKSWGRSDHFADTELYYEVDGNDVRVGRLSSPISLSTPSSSLFLPSSYPSC